MVISVSYGVCNMFDRILKYAMGFKAYSLNLTSAYNLYLKFGNSNILRKWNEQMLKNNKIKGNLLVSSQLRKSSSCRTRVHDFSATKLFELSIISMFVELLSIFSICCFQILKQREPNWIEWLGILNHHQAHRHRYSDVCALCILFYILPFYLWYRCQWDPYDWKVYSLWSLAWYYEVSADRVKVESMNRGDSMGG